MSIRTYAVAPAFAVVLAVCLGSVAPSTAQAAIIWQTPVTIANDATQISKNGNFEYAYSLGGIAAAATHVVNGVPFVYHGIGGDPSPVNIPGDTSPDISITPSQWNGFNSFGGGGVTGDYGILLNRAIYTSQTNGTQTITLNNLVAGVPYEVQFWVQDARAGSEGKNQLLDGSVTLDYNADVGAFGQFVIGEFIASGPSESFTLISATTTPQISAIQVRNLLPEPSTFVMGLLGLVASGFCRSRRRETRA